MANKPSGKARKGATVAKTAGQAEGKTKPVSFQIEAPQAGTVLVAGDFTNWEAKPLKQRKDGTWSTNLSLQPGVYEYKFVVDGQWQEDPHEDRKVHNQFGTYNSVREVV